MKKNANNIFFGIVWFNSESQMNILLGFAFSPFDDGVYSTSGALID